MKRRSSKSIPRNKIKQRVVFEFFAPLATEIGLAGTFNDWDASKAPLKKDGKGRWKVVLSLPLGRYEYRYMVDGNWQNDQRPVECVPNAFGTWNCVVEIR